MTKKPVKSLKKNKTKALKEPDLWAHVASGVTPLEQKHKNLVTEVAAVTDPKRSAKAEKKPTRRAPTAPPTPKPASQMPDLSHGSHPGLDKSSAKKMKEGKRPIEARVDLHGMTQAEAHRALDAFIDGQANAGRRCVLVITGKGGRGDGSIGVLREQVPRWLNGARLRPLVLAFSYATPKDGGEGALYVLLKRKR